MYPDFSRVLELIVHIPGQDSMDKYEEMIRLILLISNDSGRPKIGRRCTHWLSLEFVISQCIIYSCKSLAVPLTKRLRDKWKGNGRHDFSNV